jgi:Ca-activated chloride channel family protein
MKPPAKRITVTALAAAAVFAVSSVASACFMRSPLPVQVWLDHIHVDITDQVAVKTYDCTFKNPNPQAVVGGVCYMELEPGSQVDNMTVTVNGQKMEAEILSVEKANEVFNDIVKHGGSPALLEYYGNQLIQTKVPRVAPNGVVKVKLTYTTVLKKRGDLVRLQMLNTNPKALMQPLKAASVTVNIKSSEPIKNIYSPTHTIDLVERKGWDISAVWKQDDYLPKHPFVLYYQTAAEDVAASLLAHRESAGDDGYFMLMLSPTMGNGVGHISESQILPKDIVFCVDTSGSMLKDGKMDQAKAALKYCVETLRKGDRFNIVDFSTVARHFHEEGLVELNDETRAEALRYVEKLHARGGTAISEALDFSLKQLGNGSDRLKMIVFATDGLPTIGEREPKAILKSIDKLNKNDVRIFVFGEGFDVNTRLLDFLALDHRGEAEYILPKEDISKKISKFFDRVGSPVMTDLEVSFDGLGAHDIFPSKIPDVFRGEQVILFGRYRGSGETTVRVTGTIAGKRHSYEFPLTFPEVSTDDRSSFVPRLWAGQKVDFLLNEIRQSDMAQPPQELVDEVTKLALEHGILTPYTSYLMAEDIATGTTSAAGLGGGGANAYGNRQLLKRLNAKNRPAASADSAGRKEAFEASKAQSESRQRAGKSGNAAALYEQAQLALQAEGRDGAQALANVRYIGSRTFYQRGAQWEQSNYDRERDKKIKDVEVGSEEYFKLIKEDPRLAKYLALGDVVMQVKDRWYRVQQRKKG